MGTAEVLQDAGAGGCELEPDNSVIRVVTTANDQASPLGAVGQLDGGVVPDEQLVRSLAHRRALRVGVAAYGEKKLVLARGHPARGCLFGAPALETAQRGAHREQAGVVGAADPLACACAMRQCSPQGPPGSGDSISCSIVSRYIWNSAGRPNDQQRRRPHHPSRARPLSDAAGDVRRDVSHAATGP
jgi:hypothetical protein